MNQKIALPGHSASMVALDADDSNESNESSNVVMGFRAFGTSNVSGIQSTGSSQSPVWDPNERVKNAHSALKLMCESFALEPHLHQLLGERYIFIIHFYLTVLSYYKT